MAKGASCYYKCVGFLYYKLWKHLLQILSAHLLQNRNLYYGKKQVYQTEQKYDRYLNVGRLLHYVFLITFIIYFKKLTEEYQKRTRDLKFT